MRTILAGVAAVAAFAAPASAATGPFVGTVVQGETDTHTYDNNPSNNPCLQITADYTVSLRGVPASDTLTLTVLDRSVTTTGGGASLTITRGICTRFDVSVTGTSVADTATYVVTVTRQVLPPLS